MGNAARQDWAGGQDAPSAASLTGLDGCGACGMMEDKLHNMAQQLWSRAMSWVRAAGAVLHLLSRMAWRTACPWHSALVLYLGQSKEVGPTLHALQ